MRLRRIAPAMGVLALADVEEATRWCEGLTAPTPGPAR
jgi:hypothetical protein